MLGDISVRTIEYRRKAWAWTFRIKPSRDIDSIRPIAARWIKRVLDRKGHIGGRLHIAYLGVQDGKRVVETDCYVYEDVPLNYRDIFERWVDDQGRSVIYLPEISPIPPWAPLS